MANGFGSFGSGVAQGASPFLNMMYARALMQNMPGSGGGQTATSLNQAELARLNADPSTAYSNPSFSYPYSPGGTPGYPPAQPGAPQAQPQPVVPAGQTTPILPGTPQWAAANAAIPAGVTNPLVPGIGSQGLSWGGGAPSQAGGLFPQPVPYASTLPGGANALARPVVRRVAPPLGGPAQGWTMQHIGQERGYVPPTNWPTPQPGTPYFPWTGAVGTGF